MDVITEYPIWVDSSFSGLCFVGFYCLRVWVLTFTRLFSCGIFLFRVVFRRFVDWFAVVSGLISWDYLI